MIYFKIYRHLDGKFYNEKTVRFDNKGSLFNDVVEVTRVKIELIKTNPDEKIGLKRYKIIEI